MFIRMKREKRTWLFFFLTRLLTDSLIKLSGQNKRKEKKKTRVLFRITKPIHALILSTFQIRNLIYNSYHFRLHAGHLLLYFPNYQPLTASQSFFSKDSLFWSEIDKICIAFHLTLLLCNYIRDWTSLHRLFVKIFREGKISNL